MRKEVVVLLVLALFFSSVTAYMTFFMGPSITGHASTGTVSLIVAGDGPTIFIHSPLNTTYFFSTITNYTLDLNVSSPSTDIGAWFFRLEDLENNVEVNETTIFTPNISFNAVRGSNKLTVYANDSSGNVGSKSVIFSVSVPNSAPLLGNISSPLYVCEASALHYDFNATDVDQGDLLVSVSPTTPFFVFPNSFSGEKTVYSELFSGTLTKSNVGSHNRTLSVTDGQYSDSKNLTINVIEINNEPFINNIGVQTVWSQGQNSSFSKTVEATDVEDGDWTGLNLTFNLSFNGETPFFGINPYGVMSFVANSSLIGVHNLTVCVKDHALSVISPNISMCDNDGLSKITCQNFSLTVTNQNRAPTITSYFPEQEDLNVTGTEPLYFNVSTFDPDGTIPDVYWYRDGVFSFWTLGETDSEYSFSYPCGLDGQRSLTAVVTDGELNDSVSWNISLTGVACPLNASSGKGGGGGGGAPFCAPQWGCNDWQVCQNTETSLINGVIGQSDYREITELCAAAGYPEQACGYQTRSCFDNHFCNSTVAAPDLIQACPYSSNPSCADGIKNCHDGTCELLIDCGGPCGLCSSCSDGVQNQGELGIDCGGPCPFACPAQIPFIQASVWRTITLWIFWLLLLILLLILIRRIWRLVEVHRELQKEKRIQSALSK